MQYKIGIVTTGAIRGKSSKKVFPELGLQFLKLRRWFTKVCLFYKIFLEKSPSYLFQLIPRNSNVYATSSKSNTSPSVKIRHNFFKDSIFPAVMTD